MKFHNDDCSKSSPWRCITFQLPDEQEREDMVLKSTLSLKMSQSIQVSWADLPQDPANDLSLMGKLKMLTACCRMLLPIYWTISARLGSAPSCCGVCNKKHLPVFSRSGSCYTTAAWLSSNSLDVCIPSLWPLVKKEVASQSWLQEHVSTLRMTTERVQPNVRPTICTFI
jgi:hypothetical protein